MPFETSPFFPPPPSFMPLYLFFIRGRYRWHQNRLLQSCPQKVTLHKTANPLSIKSQLRLQADPRRLWPIVSQRFEQDGQQQRRAAKAASLSCLSVHPFIGVASVTANGRSATACVVAIHKRGRLPSRSLDTPPLCRAEARVPYWAGSCRCSWRRRHPAPSVCRSGGHSFAA